MIDWGLAIKSGGRLSTNLGTRYFKAPEMLIGDEDYDEKVDVWSAGCVMASMLFRVSIFFKGMCDHDILLSIIKVLGMSEFEAYLSRNNLEMPDDLKRWTKGRTYDKKAWSSFLPPS